MPAVLVAKPIAPTKSTAAKIDKGDERGVGRASMPQAPVPAVPRATPGAGAKPVAPPSVAKPEPARATQPIPSATPSPSKSMKSQPLGEPRAVHVPTPSPGVVQGTPGVVGALAKAGARTATEKPPPFSSHVGPSPSPASVVQAAVAPPKGPVVSDFPVMRSATLILDEPPADHPKQPSSAGDPRPNGPPLVVPPAHAAAANAVTKSPPWTEAAAEMGRALSAGVRRTVESIREITSSMLLEDSEEHLGPNELSSSLLVEDTSEVDASSAAVTKHNVPIPAAVRHGVPPPAVPAPKVPPKDSSDLATLPVGQISSITTADILPGLDPPIETAKGEPHRPVSPTRVDSAHVPWVARLRGVASSVARARHVFAPRSAKWWIPSVLVVGVVAVGVYGERSRGRRHAESRGVETPAVPNQPDLAISGPPSAVNSAEGVVAAPPRGCTVAGPSRVVAESALLSAGVEVRALRTGIGLGFVPADHQATVIRLDPKLLSVGQMANVRAPDGTRRVTPILAASGAFTPGIDSDQKTDKVLGRRTIAVEPPMQIGTLGGQLVWSRGGGHVVGKLWPLDVGADVDAIRGAWAPGIDHGVVALTFRRAGSVWIGSLDTSGSPVPIGSLSRIAGLGPAVGSPAIAFDGATVMVVWADRAASDDPWRLRLVRFRNGDTPGEPNTFSPPSGGRGGQAMSPSLAVVPGIGFLLSWTEGAMSAHDVRALTLANDGTPMGAPMTISNEGVNAGQGQAAIDLDGHGLVAFLQGGGGVYQLAATPITCPVRSPQ